MPLARPAWAADFWDRNRWRVVRARRAVGSARAVDQHRRFLEAVLRRERGPRDYTVHGHPVRLVHGSHDPWVFHEVFVDRFYDLPTDFPAPARVADLGGNIGMFALYTAIHWPEAEVVAFEPDPANAERYRWMMSQNHVRGRLVQACAAAGEGSVPFALGGESLAHITADGSGTHVPAVDAFPELQGVDLIKMDIEGGEWSLLLDPRFARLTARTVMMEYHPHLCPEPDARAAAMDALRQAGFSAETIFHDRDSGVGMLRAFREPAPAG